MKQKQIDLESHVGAPITILVDDIPSAGYRWSLTQLSELVTIEPTHPIDVPPSLAGLVGGIRSKEFNLWARRVGSGTLTFELLRPFVPEEPAEVLTVNLTILPKLKVQGWTPEGWDPIGEVEI